MNEYRQKEPWLAKLLKFIAQYVVGVSWVWYKLILPIYQKLFSITKPIFVFFYDNIWCKFVFLKNGSFSKTRAGIFVILIYIFVMSFSNIVWTIFNTILFVTTYEKEIVYLSNSQEINSEEDIHAIRGCESLTCTEENAIYFRVRPTIITHTYSVFSHGGLFYPDLTASIVAPGMNKCEIYTYGIRMKTLMRNWDIYPDMLSGMCKQVSDD